MSLSLSPSLLRLAIALLLALPAGAWARRASAEGAVFEATDYLVSTLSPDGRFGAGHDTATGRGIRIVDGAVELLGQLPTGEPLLAAGGMSDDGRVIAGWARRLQGGTYLWEDGVVEELTDFPPDHRVDFDRVSADGTTIVGLVDPPIPGSTITDHRAARWSRATGFVFLDVPAGATSSRARAVSGHGRVIAGDVSGPGSVGGAYLWVDDIPMLLPGVPGASRSSSAWDLSRDGRIAVGFANLFGPGFEATRWVDGVAEGLGDLPGGASSSRAFATSDDGRVVGGWGRTDATLQQAVLWDPHNGMRDLRVLIEEEFGIPLPGWQLFQVDEIRADGRVIAGFGRTPDVFFQGWTLTLPSACRDTLDDDGDGRADWPEDPGCLDPDDETESSRDDVAIDVAPFGDVGRVNLRPHRRVRVAILGSASFDPATLDLTTLGPLGAPPLANGPGRGRGRDVNHDGFRDRVLHFDALATGLAAGDSQVCLRGEADGLGFRACAPVAIRWPGCAGPGPLAVVLLAPWAFLAGRRRTS